MESFNRLASNSDCWESANLQGRSKVVVVLEPLEPKQSLDDILDVRELEEGIYGCYCVLDVGRARRISSLANDFMVLPVGKGSMGYACVMLSV